MSSGQALGLARSRGWVIRVRYISWAYRRTTKHGAVGDYYRSTGIIEGALREVRESETFSDGWLTPWKAFAERLDGVS